MEEIKINLGMFGWKADNGDEGRDILQGKAIQDIAMEKYAKACDAYTDDPGTDDTEYQVADFIRDNYQKLNQILEQLYKHYRTSSIWGWKYFRYEDGDYILPEKLYKLVKQKLSYVEREWALS